MTSSHSRRSRQSRAACVQGSLPPIRMCFPRRKLTKTWRWFPDVQNNAWTYILCWHTRLLHNIQKRQCRVTIMLMENTNFNNQWLGTLCTQPKTDTAKKAVEQDEEKQAEVVRTNIGDQTEQALEGSLERRPDVIVQRACVHWQRVASRGLHGLVRGSERIFARRMISITWVPQQRSVSRRRDHQAVACDGA